MIRFFLIIFLSLSSIPNGKAQFSVQTQYYSSLQNNENTYTASSIYEASWHYWTRLKNYRIEFLPGLLYQSPQTNQGSIHNLGITLPVSFYMLDFVNDCDCPTFSKNAYWFQKGFFLRLTPSWTTNITQTDQEIFDHLLSGSISAGLDIGLSDLITFTPFLGYSQIHSLSAKDQYSNYIHVGFSVLFRHDYRRRYR